MYAMRPNTSNAIPETLELRPCLYVTYVSGVADHKYPFEAMVHLFHP